jgi:hypothetical protein
MITTTLMEFFLDVQTVSIWASFRAMFPAFDSMTAYPDAVLTMYASFATNYISTSPNCSSWQGLSTAQQTYAQNLMMAHIAQIQANISSNSAGSTGFSTSKHVKDVGYTVQPPPSSDAFDYWLNLTPYGMQLSALLSLVSVGGFMVGGSPEGLAFRGFGGGFGH